MTAAAPIDAARARQIFEYRDGALWSRRRRGSSPAGTRVGVMRKDGYLRVIDQGRELMVHRLVWALHHDDVPPVLDHINGIRTDNRIENLRAASHLGNACNVKAVWGAVPYKGVSRSQSAGKFQASIRARYIGVFDTAEAAARAYDVEATRLFGAFARTNASLGLV